MEEQRKHSENQNVKEWIKVILIFLFIFLPIRLFIAKPFIVEGSSMDPNFETGHYLIVDQISYYFENPKRGEVIVFEFPGDEKKYLIKRIIGLPGETVRIRDGQVYIINNENPKGLKLDEAYLTHHSNENLEKILGDEEYFVMGDNRPASYDSRMWGTLARDHITGRPVLRLYPFGEISIFPGRAG